MDMDNSQEKYKHLIGRRIIMIKSYGRASKDAIGTIKHIYYSVDYIKNPCIGIEFDEYCGGHDLCGNVKDNYGWYVFEDMFRLFNSNKRIN